VSTPTVCARPLAKTHAADAVKRMRSHAHLATEGSATKLPHVA
jgi:hypothetical protein